MTFIMLAKVPQIYRQECRHDDVVFYLLERSVSNPNGWRRSYRNAVYELSPCHDL